MDEAMRETQVRTQLNGLKALVEQQEKALDVLYERLKPALNESAKSEVGVAPVSAMVLCPLANELRGICINLQERVDKINWFTRQLEL